MSGSALNILVAEDNPVNQRVVHKMLERLGHQVTLAPNGAVAVSEACTGSFDLILMDCMMPVMNGLEATRVLRSRERTASLPIIAVTANATAEDRKACLDVGMDDHLAKPIRLQSLRELLEGLYTKGMLERRKSA